MLPLAACHSNTQRNEGAACRGATRSFAASGFDTVDLRGPDEIDVKTGPATR
ncbi:hypothetical protein [Sphingomonas xinjiangensis]|uniref:Uncharacterized protein n=1 Tax=Sphingomonas xinjiangensis TaxID=643568 RepID=A0A840YR65_9SPHN|nr:hypothetical protein [Sphingomonas xinjiangensis]MBB5711971.1 hypothetical protein [Sphingomonas xinjiangensis]